ncbi:Zinc finger CCHC domain-containing protein 24 [Armadillidium nasatum]|uniref:Zinc finger CCHC domain-containing protein 24 n=1 Tax=Armadillidium nasatum TaxID=96803 RepID=A0A5N5T8C1_9CRUS|nr:Zinc finger CCHC domain-containing protein 24 [Armadillidium nasatum]
MKDTKKKDNKDTSSITLDISKLSLDDKPKLTPYQGVQNAKKDWSSAYSWANTHQQCKTCLAEIYPYRQAKLKPSADKKEYRPPHQDKLEPGKGDIDSTTPHRMNLCEKCKELGYFCKRFRP